VGSAAAAAAADKVFADVVAVQCRDIADPEADAEEWTVAAAHIGPEALADSLVYSGPYLSFAAAAAAAEEEVLHFASREEEEAEVVWVTMTTAQDQSVVLYCSAMKRNQEAPQAVAGWILAGFALGPQKTRPPYHLLFLFWPHRSRQGSATQSYRLEQHHLSKIQRSVSAAYALDPAAAESSCGTARYLASQQPNRSESLPLLSTVRRARPGTMLFVRKVPSASLDPSLRGPLRLLLSV